MDKNLKMKEDTQVLKHVEDLTKFLDKKNIFNQITTRAADPNTKSLIDFKSVDEKSLALIADRMPEINRACNVFGRQNSQTTGKLMSLNMISQTPFRCLKQCLAKIERKTSALNENLFKLREEKVELEELVYDRDLLLEKIRMKEVVDENKADFGVQKLLIEIEKKIASVGNSTIYIEGALKEIGMYQDAYDEIIETHNLPKNWDEADFEDMEIREHVQTAFNHGIRDILMTGRLNVGTMEYLEQFGINPATAAPLIHNYLEKTQPQTDDDGKVQLPDISQLYNFLDEMFELFKDEYKKAAAKIGLKKVVSRDFLYTE